MLELGLTVQSAFWWGVAAATLGWIALAFASAVILGLIIRRSEAAMDGEAEQLAAQQQEILQAAHAAHRAADAAPEAADAGSAVPSESGTRYKPVVAEVSGSAQTLRKTGQGG